MLPFQVRRFTLGSGEEVVVLTDQHGMPHFWPNVFVTMEYRNTSKSANTSIKVLRTLGMAQMWARINRRNLDHDLTLGDFLSVEDAESLVDFLGLCADDQEQRAREAERPVRVPNLVRLESVRPHPRASKVVPRRRVNNVEIANRVRWVAAYVEWLYERRLGSLARQRRQPEVIRTVGRRVIDRLRALAPHAPSRSDDDVALEGVDEEVMERIEQALIPGAPKNPFTPGFFQERNYLLWCLLSDTGARRHEVLEAKADHVKYSTRRFEIRTSKTLQRTVPIGPKTADAFDMFIEHRWSKLPKEARRRGYLFTDEKGRHLSLRAINRIFERVRERVDGVPEFMAPHTVRRTWNDRFSKQIDAIPEGKRPKAAAETMMRNRLQGWSGESSMGARYARRHVKRAADEIAERMTCNAKIPPRRGKKPPVASDG